MEFTKCFKKSLLTVGAPHLNKDQFHRYMNILLLESKIDEIKKWGLSGQSFFRSLSKKENQLQRLTKGLSPEEVLEEMVYLSRE